MIPETYPDDLVYHPEHAWARVDGATAVFGITWFAQDALNEVVYVEPPRSGATVSAGAPYARVESMKAISDVFAPLSGELLEVNELLDARPHLLNEDPYGDGWIIGVRLSDPAELLALLDAGSYRKLLAIR